MTDKSRTMIEQLTASLGKQISVYQELDAMQTIRELQQQEVIRETPWFPEYVKTKSSDAMDSIKEAIECAEPETIADVLSLAILARSRIDDILAPYTDQDEDQRRISHMMAAIIRGLDRLSPNNPLVETRYYVSERDFRSSNDEIAIIMEALRSIEGGATQAA